MRENIYLKKYTTRDRKKYPPFAYHPDPVRTQVFEENDPPVICECCGEKTKLSYTYPFISEVYDIDALCPACIASGKPAAEKDGEYHRPEYLEQVDDPAAAETLLHHTPGILSYDDVLWRAHCDDYCAYLGVYTYEELKREGLLSELWEDPLTDCSRWNDMTLAKSLNEYQLGFLIHVFECLTCRRHLFFIDEDYEGRYE